MTLAWHLKICGALLIALALLHPAFARHLRWKEDLQAVPLLTRQVFWVHCLFIVVVLLLFGVLSLFFTRALLEPTALARVVLAGLVIFWGLRLVAQHFIYSPALWRGDRFKTVMHILFTGLWTYFIVVYAAALRLQLKE